MGIVARQLPQPVMSSGGASTGTMTQQQPQQNALQQQTNGGSTQGGKKPLSGGSSGGPTPAGTPVQNGTGGQGPTPPPLTNAPKYGTLVPNRIFVGGISASTTEGELMQLFSAYGTVKAAKIIQDRAGVSKGYGFITFESEDDARRSFRDSDSIILRERRLNIAPAIKKQPFGRPPAAPPYDTHGPSDGRSPAPATHQALQPPMPPFFFGGAPQFYPGAAAYYAPPMMSSMSTAAAQASVQVSQANQEHAAAAAAQQAVYQAPPVYQAQTGPPQAGPYASMMFPQTIYMPQQYPTMVPYDYTIYGAGPAASVNGGVPPPFANSGPASNGSDQQPRGGPCYASAPGPPEGTFLYAAPPPHHLFHPGATLDPTGGASGSIYASADGTFDSMAHHAAAMGHFGPIASPYGMTEQENPFVEHPDPSGTPHSFLTATPPSADQRSTATPVVSILSLDHQQEKDPASMQGGRRPPPPPPLSLLQTAQPHGNMHQIHQHNNHANHHHHHHQSPPQQQQQQQLQRRGGGGYYQVNGQQPPSQQRRTFSRPFNVQHHTHHMQTQPPTFGPPSRRPRKPQRRSHGSSNPNNEIGAGDAPLPSDDLGAQMEALKL